MSHTHSPDEARLAELESVVDALRSQEVDAVVSTDKVLMLRLREAEQALAESEAWLKLVIDAGGVGLLDWDLQSDSARCNETFCRMIGPDPDSVSTFKDWLDLVHPNDRDLVQIAIDNALKHGNACAFDCRVHVNDQVRWLEYRGELKHDESGKPTRMLGALRDITRRKEAELELGSAKQKMEDRVAARTHALHRQTLQLRKLAAQAISSEHRERKRLSTLLHDHLQQYLVAAKLQLHSVKHSTDIDNLQEAVKKCIPLMEESIELARGLSRELRPPVLYEDGFVAALRWLCGEKREQYGLHVILDAEDNAEPIGDDLKSLLFESVRELLFNVAKYACVSEARVQIRRTAENGIQITVDDSGVGFDPNQVTHRDGSGVGLFRIRERLASIGGGVDIFSKPGEGTRVILRAPIDIPAEQSSPGKHYLPGILDSNIPEDRIRVLIVDDHCLVREGIAAMVEGPSMTVVAQAADGVEAIDIVEKCRPQVILMDLNMPRMNGIEATRAIRTRWPGIAIIGLSVQDDEATAQSLKDAGADAFIPKNHEPEELFETILTII